ncbi:hypothetical protein GCM10009663_25460 [Kitasatospora arboriphila]|uniref:Uncharacterized protein n=1 Tax=Kitasatospora arboriphila TaxID=258052 RepID=A0ABP4DZ87_9ACTN
MRSGGSEPRACRAASPPWPAAGAGRAVVAVSSGQFDELGGPAGGLRQQPQPGQVLPVDPVGDQAEPARADVLVVRDVEVASADRHRVGAAEDAVGEGRGGGGGAGEGRAVGQQPFDVFAEPLVEHPQHDPDARVGALGGQRRVDVLLVVAVDQGDAERAFDPGGPQRLLGHRAVLQYGGDAGQPPDPRPVVAVPVRQHGDHRHLVVLRQLQHQPVGQRVPAAHDVVPAVSVPCHTGEAYAQNPSGGRPEGV